MNYCVGSLCPYEIEHAEANHERYGLMIKSRMTPEQEEELLEYYRLHDNPGS